MKKYGKLGSEPAPGQCPVARAFVADGIVSTVQTTTTLCESCGIHQRMRHKRRCDVCNATMGEVLNDGDRVTIETVGRERYTNNVIAHAAVMAGMRMGPFIRTLLDELAKAHGMKVSELCAPLDALPPVCCKSCGHPLPINGPYYMLCACGAERADVAIPAGRDCELCGAKEGRPHSEQCQSAGRE